MQVTHIHGHLLQEEGYYPFGLEMKAISSQAAMKMQTRYKFNGGTMLETSFDVDYYETYFRQYDAQTGRFTGVDALAEKTFSETPYHFGSDNPISFNDPSGAMKQYNESGRPMRDRPTNWNPQLRILPEEYTSFWDKYWSNPFAAAEMNANLGRGDGDALSEKIGSFTVDKYGNIFTVGAIAEGLFQGFTNAIENTDDKGNWEFNFQLQQFDVFDKDDKKMGVVSVLGYDYLEFVNEKGRINRGLEIKLAFSYLTDYEGRRNQKWNWVQLVTTNTPYGHEKANTPYYDPSLPKNAFHYYYPESSVSFGDRPSRDEIHGNVSWTAQLSLVDMNDKRYYITFSYGWTFINNVFTKIPFQQIPNSTKAP
ncbi:MAG: hypothetical protein JST21_12210 [Bacteroidetes bacterium]|nr:hypothetical protein [Bacteroidota bacterium]